MPNQDTQDDFDLTIGRLDRILSKLVLWSKASYLNIWGVANQQTLKHHAEDMIAAGGKILEEHKKYDKRRRRNDAGKMG